MAEAKNNTSTFPTIASHHWRLLDLGYPPADLRASRSVTNLMAITDDVFNREFGEDAWLVQKIFTEMYKQISLKRGVVDILSLSTGLNWAYSTTHTRCQKLAELGYLDLSKVGRSTALAWTDYALHKFMKATCDVYERAYAANDSTMSAKESR